MSRVIILRDFTGYPGGDERSEQRFRAGPEAIEVADDFAELIVAKGHARRADADVAGGPDVIGIDGGAADFDGDSE